MKMVCLCIVISFGAFAQFGNYAANYFDGASSLEGKKILRRLGGLAPQEISKVFLSLFSEEKVPQKASFVQGFEPMIEKECLGGRGYNRCVKKRYEAIVDFLRFQNLIGDPAYLILKYDNPRLPALKDYYSKLKRLKEIRCGEICPFVDLSPLYTRASSVTSNGFRGITPRQYLLFNYSLPQIIQLSNLARKMVKVMNSRSASIHIDLQGMEDINMELSYSEKYRLGVKIAWMELNKLQYDPSFGKKARMIDVLFAGVETGVFSGDVLKELAYHPALVDGYRTKGKSYMAILKNLAKVALYNTPVVGQFAVIPILLWETKESLEEQRDANSRSTHLF